MKLLIISYSQTLNAHNCLILEGPGEGTVVTVDLSVDGDLVHKDPNTLDGRTVECGFIMPFQYVASKVTLLPDEEKKPA